MIVKQNKDNGLQLWPTEHQLPTAFLQKWRFNGLYGFFKEDLVQFFD